jgi:hypothetical protein
MTERSLMGVKVHNSVSDKAEMKSNDEWICEMVYVRERTRGLFQYAITAFVQGSEKNRQTAQDYANPGFETSTSTNQGKPP